MKLSIITACKNAEATICANIDASRNKIANHDNVEQIYVYGESSDRTRSILQKNSHGRLVTGADYGISHAFNLGIAESCGEWLLFVNADDCLHPLLDLDKLIQVLDTQNARTGFCYGQIEMVDDLNAPTIRQRFGHPNDQNLLPFRMTLPHQGLLTRRSYVETYGTFDESYLVGMDYEFVLRGFRTVKITFIPMLISEMQMGGISAQARGLGLRERMKIQIESGVQSPLSARLLRAYFEVRLHLPQFRFLPLLRRLKSWR